MRCLEGRNLRVDVHERSLPWRQTTGKAQRCCSMGRNTMPSNLRRACDGSLDRDLLATPIPHKTGPHHTKVGVKTLTWRSAARRKASIAAHAAPWVRGPSRRVQPRGPWRGGMIVGQAIVNTHSRATSTANAETKRPTRRTSFSRSNASRAISAWRCGKTAPNGRATKHGARSAACRSTRPIDAVAVSSQRSTRAAIAATTTRAPGSSVRQTRLRSIRTSSSIGGASALTPPQAGGSLRVRHISNTLAI